MPLRKELRNGGICGYWSIVYFNNSDNTKLETYNTSCLKEK